MSEEKTLLILDLNTIQLQMTLRHKELILRGIPDPEATRAVNAEFVDYPTPTDVIPWPGPITGLDLAGNNYPELIFASATPPLILPQENFPGPYDTGNYNPYPNNPTPDVNGIGGISNTYEITNPPAPYSSNWNGLANDINSQPPTSGITGYNYDQSVPPWRYDIQSSQGIIFNDTPNIILLPSGGLNETIAKIKRIKISTPLQEAIGQVYSQFKWLDDEYIKKAKKIADEDNSRLYLIRAAVESVTDHRSEGEEYRRKLAGKELHGMARTAVGTKMDINHQPEFETNAIILDSEYDSVRREIQMVVLEKDSIVNEAIHNGSITAVSINGGLPRTQELETCDDNCTSGDCEICNVPTGVVLGELDGIGMTWVVTDPRGIFWNGEHIPQAEPGIKSTMIQIL